MNNYIVLLSGGLDSVVSLAVIKETANNILTLTFDYGQKSIENELKSASSISKFYNTEHRVIKLDWLSKISKSALSSEKEIPIINEDQLNDINITKNSADSVWVPNRNALFVNIAASFAEAMNYQYIILGANKEEGTTFKDNTIDFVNAVNNSLINSTNSNIQLLTPLINYNKKDIVKIGIELNIPFNLIYSCYNNSEKHCGKCESCLRLKRALKLNNRLDLINEVFE